MESMEPTLLPTHLLIDKAHAPLRRVLSAGDIIVFHPPGSTPGDTPFIKRVIGVAATTSRSKAAPCT